MPGSVQHNTAVDSITKVPIITGKELKSMKNRNDLQIRSRTPLTSKVKNVLKKSVPASSVLHNIMAVFMLRTFITLKPSSIKTESKEDAFNVCLH